MTLSHELRTPLNAVLGWVGILARGAVADAERPRVLATIQRNAQAQTRLIEDLLEVSRAISGKLQLPIALPLRAVQDQRFDDETAVGSGSC